MHRILIVLLFSLSLPALAEETWKVSDVRAGMKGYGKSVFHGTEIERFNVEVIDVLRNFFPKQDVILIRCSANHVVEEANIIAGMSGSPIYLFPPGEQSGEKLAGALAYAWSFSKQPIAGVTPIEYMIQEMERPLEKTGRLQMPPSSPVQPCATPLVLGGFAPRAIDALTKALDGTGVVPVEGGGGGEANGPDIQLVPGAAIGVTLMRGDFDATATGTVTWVDGDRVLAFGHSFFDGGEIAMPITTCVIHTVLPSIARSFKLSSPVKTVGTLVQDRNNAVFGRIGKAGDLLPFSLRLENAKTGRTNTYHADIVRHPFLTGMMMMSAVSSALEVFEESMEENSAVAETTIEVEGHAPVTAKQTYDNSLSVFQPSYLDKVMRVLMNRLEAPKVKSVSLVIKVVHRPERAQVESVVLEEDHAGPGDTVTARVTLRPYRSERVTKEIPVRIPQDTPDGDIVLQVSAGTAVEPDLPPPDDLDGLLGWIAAENDSTSLVTVVEAPGFDLRYRGMVLRRLPNSILGSWIPEITEPAQLARETSRAVTPTDWVLAGSASVKIHVKRQSKK